MNSGNTVMKLTTVGSSDL